MDNLSDFFTDPIDCTFTSTTGPKVAVDAKAVLEVAKRLQSNKPPKILVYKASILEAGILPENTIMVSSDIAKLFEEVIKKGT